MASFLPAIFLVLGTVKTRVLRRHDKGEEKPVGRFSVFRLRVACARGTVRQRLAIIYGSCMPL